jgi:hypothetical protein
MFSVYTLMKLAPKYMHINIPRNNKIAQKTQTKVQTLLMKKEINSYTKRNKN